MISNSTSGRYAEPVQVVNRLYFGALAALNGCIGCLRADFRISVGRLRHHWLILVRTCFGVFPVHRLKAWVKALTS
jgi:hypothetical protein